MEKEIVERYAFHDLAALKRFLNGFKDIDLAVVYPESADYWRLDWIEETLEDGSKVNNVRIRTVYSYED